MRALLIVNGTASTVNNEREQGVIDALRDRVSLDVARTTAPGDATSAARSGADDAVDIVFCLGGDGTANETAWGLLDRDAAFVSLPGGSTNVFSRSLGFPRDARHAALSALRSFEQQVPSPAGVGELEVASPGAAGDHRFDPSGRRPFLFHCGAGFDAQVTERVEAKPHLKRRLGHLFFATAAAATWFDRSTASISVTCLGADGTHHAPIQDTKFAVASNTDPYSYLVSRPLAIAPMAELDAPLVATAATSLSLAATGRILTGALRTGASVTGASGLAQISDAAEIRWRSTDPFALQADGEPLGRHTEVVLRHRPNALRVVRPAATER